MNRILCGVLSLVLIIIFNSSKESDTLAQTRAKGSAGRKSSSVLSLNEQAQREATAYWKKRVVACGDSFYKWGRISINGPLVLIEMKDMTIETQGASPAPPRTQADILNEKENPSNLHWSGRSILSHSVYRYMPRDRRVWEPWNNGGREVINIEKRNGNWILPQDDKSITCKEVDAYTLKPGAIPEILPSISQDGVFIFPARYSKWFSLGRGPLRLSMESVFPRVFVRRDDSYGETPLDSDHNKDWELGTKTKVPNIKRGALIVKIGESGEPFAPFQESKMLNMNSSDDWGFEYRFNTTEEIFVAINDDDYSDNRGAFKFKLKGLEPNSPYIARPVAPPGNVALPSTRLRTFAGHNSFRLSYPENWREIPGTDSMAFAPEGAYKQLQGRNIVTHGVEVGFTPAAGYNLREATDIFINTLAQSNRDLRAQGQYQRGEVSGHTALTITLTNVNGATGQSEIVTIYTTLLPNRNLLHIMAVAPRREHDTYKEAFGAILKSFRFNDEE